MLKILIKQLNNAGIDFCGQVSPQILNLDVLAENDEIAFQKPITYNLHISEVSEGVLVTGSVSTQAGCNCDRCLEDFDKTIELNDICHYYENVANLSELDISPEIREDLLISLSMKHLCSEDCEGIELPDELKQKNVIISDEIIENNPWNQLDSLKL
jgi:uncharacterized metal-binding protein YceD (DUF177 family)